MAEIVNLRLVRKAEARAAASAEADANRAAFGRTKAEKKETAARTAKSKQYLDGHRRETDDRS